MRRLCFYKFSTKGQETPRDVDIIMRPVVRHGVQILWPLFFLLVGCTINHDLKVSPCSPYAKVGQTQGEVKSSKGDLYVLLPEQNGKAGSIRVANAAGFQVLNKPGDMTRVEDYNRPPVSPRPLDEKEIASLFGVALSSQPDLPRRFISFTLWFESDKAKLTDASKQTLPEILRMIKIRQSKEIIKGGPKLRRYKGG